MKDGIRWTRVVKAKTEADDPTKFYVQQVEYMGKPSDSLMVYPYGIHANVPADAFGLMFSIQGNPDNRGTIAWTPKNRPDLAGGEVAFYHPPTDAFIIWKANGDLDIETGNAGIGQINVKSGNINIKSGDITIESGDIDITSGTIAVDSGDITIESGDIDITNGDITVSGGNVDITATDVAVLSPLTTVTGALTVTGLLTAGGIATSGGGNADITGDLEVTGSTILGSTVTSGGVDISDTHTHPQGNDSGSNTEVDTGGPQ